MRTFRVLRLFNKLKSLRTLINALAASLMAVLNAFLLVILICVLYAILGVELFGDKKPELFGNFILSYWTVREGLNACTCVSVCLDGGGVWVRVCHVA
jgi:voltage-gated sodium channel